MGEESRAWPQSSSISCLPRPRAYGHHCTCSQDLGPPAHPKSPNAQGSAFTECSWCGPQPWGASPRWLPPSTRHTLLSFLPLSKLFSLPWLVWLSGLGIIPQTTKSPVRFLVRAYEWVVGLIPVRACVRGNQSMFLSYIDVFLSPFLSLSKKNCNE